MGLWKETYCPHCGQPGARKFLWWLKCGNSKCEKYAGSTAKAESQKAARVLSGRFDAGTNAVEICYCNHEKQIKRYRGDRNTLRDKGKHLSLCLEPTGKRVSFLKSRLQNLAELEPLIQIVRSTPGPTSVERQILGYYKKRGGSSPRHAEILRKYPSLSA